MNKISQIINRAGLDFNDRMFVIANEEYFSQFGKYDWAETKPITEVNQEVLSEYQWQLIKPDQDAISQKVYQDKNHLGYYIRAAENKTAVAPINTCYVISRPKTEQNVQNLIVAEDNSKLQILTGCTALHQMTENIHNGVTEIYVGKNAQVTFTMIHSWSEQSRVYPRTAVKVADGGKFISNYLIFDPVSKLDTNPKVLLEGKNSKAVLNSFICSHPQSNVELGGEIHLNGQGSSGEILTHAVVSGGKTITRGTLFGRAEEIRGHLECSAIVLSPEAEFQTIPALHSELDNLNLSHEASIGKISSRQIEYLQTRGISNQKAKQMIVQGFIDDSVGDLTPVLQLKINNLLDQVKEGL